MKLQNNLYNIIESDTEAGVYRISLDSECMIYKAHFPEMPITPGVCIIQIATELFELLQQRPLALAEVVNAKFLAVINPLQKKEIEYRFSKISPNETDGTVKVSVAVTHGDTTCAKLSLLYKTA